MSVVHVPPFITGISSALQVSEIAGIKDGVYDAGVEDGDDPVPGWSAGDGTGSGRQHGRYQGPDCQGSESNAAQCEIRRSGNTMIICDNV